MDVHIAKTQHEYACMAATHITDICHKCEHVTVAFSGGHAPIPVFDYIVKHAEFDPSCHASIFEVDERYVPAAHPQSNQKMIMEHLITPIQRREHHDPIAAANFFNTNLSIRKALRAYNLLLKDRLQTADYLFDLCVLGIGDNGHTASIFPGTRAIKTRKLVAHTRSTSSEIKDRLTITFAAIMQSKHVLVLLQGKDDKQALQKMKDESVSIKEFPAKKLLEHPELTIIYGDY